MFKFSLVQTYILGYLAEHFVCSEIIAEYRLSQFAMERAAIITKNRIMMGDLSGDDAIVAAFNSEIQFQLLTIRSVE